MAARDGYAYVGHMASPHGDLTLINVEHVGPSPERDAGGLQVFDISDKSAPRQIGFFRCAGTEARRFDFDGRYVYFSP